MSLTTLATAKTLLGIASSDTSQDTALTSFLRGAAARIRAYCSQYLGGLITSVSTANPASISSPGHGLKNGSSILIGGTGTALDGTTQVITLIDQDTFTVAASGGAGSSAGWYLPTLTEYYGGSGDRFLILNQRPVYSVTSVYLDTTGFFGDPSGSFDSTKLQVDGTDYAIDKPRGQLIRQTGFWPQTRDTSQGFLANNRYRGLGNVKVTYTPGYDGGVPADLQDACASLAIQMRQMVLRGGPLQGESLDYYSYTRLDPARLKGALSSVEGVLSAYKRWIV